MRKLIAGLFLLFQMNQLSLAEDSPKRCFAITPQNGVANLGVYNNLLGSIMINQCTGETWMLVDDGNDSTSVRRWAPLTKRDREMVFGKGR
jgi:hypothetical protein